MSVKYIDELILDIYVKKEFINDINFNKKEDLEKYLKTLFRRLKNKYKIIIEGFYEIIVYVDKYYGVIFHLEKEDLEYYNYYKNQVDMRLTIINANFLYEVEDVPIKILNKIKILNEDNKIYLTISNKLNDLEMMYLIENSKIIYKKEK